MSDEQDYRYDLFISYNRADEGWAEQLAARLEQEDHQGRKLNVFFAPWDILPGDSIDDQLENALTKSRKVGLVITPESVSSEWVKEERHATHHADVARRERRLIPLYRRTCEIPLFLRPIKHVDFRDDDKFENGIRVLVAVIKGERLPRGEVQTTRKDISPLVLIDPKVRTKLRALEQLAQEKLIEESIKQEYQRKILDKLIDMD